MLLDLACDYQAYSFGDPREPVETLSNHCPFILTFVVDTWPGTGNFFRNSRPKACSSPSVCGNKPTATESCRLNSEPGNGVPWVPKNDRSTAFMICCILQGFLPRFRWLICVFDRIPRFVSIIITYIISNGLQKTTRTNTLRVHEKSSFWFVPSSPKVHHSFLSKLSIAKFFRCYILMMIAAVETNDVPSSTWSSLVLILTFLLKILSPRQLNWDLHVCFSQCFIDKTNMIFDGPLLPDWFSYNIQSSCKILATE